jgi:hypothetical protein
MEKFSYKFKKKKDVKLFVKKNFQSDVYKYHVRLILQEGDDVFYTSLNSEISTTLDKFNKNLDELYHSYLEKYNIEVQFILGIELIIYIIKDYLNIKELNVKKRYMDISFYIINNRNVLRNKSIIKNIIVNDIARKENNVSISSYVKVKNYINNCIDLFKLCL